MSALWALDLYAEGTLELCAERLEDLCAEHLLERQKEFYSGFLRGGKGQKI